MSKANQAFKQNEDAVSPVIGVILMVAITVVLAAVVFVLVSNLSKNSNQSAPNISFNQDKSAKTLTIISADQANWKDIKATIVKTPSTASCGSTDASGTAITSGNALSTKTISAGDKITVTNTGGTSAAGDVCTIKLTFTPANQLLGTWDFTF